MDVVPKRRTQMSMSRSKIHSMKRYPRGGIRQHPRGGWEVRLMANGRPYYERLPHTATLSDAEKVLDALVLAADSGVGDLTVKDTLERYLSAKEAGWSPSTRKTQPYHAQAIISAIGSEVLFALKPGTIQEAYDAWIADEVSPGTVKRRHGVLRAALKHAVARGWIGRSPVYGVEVPKLEVAPMDLPSHESVVSAISRLPKQQRRLQVVAGLALASGARRGELVALRWKDLDFEDSTVRLNASIAEGPKGLVRKATKTGSVRTIKLDAETMADLKRWRAECAKHCLQLGVALNDDSPLFGAPADPGSPVRPSRLTQDWSRWREKVGLGGLRFHDLRHRHATTLLEEGIAIHQVAYRLGHASAVITMAVYAHAIRGNDEASALAITRARGGSLSAIS